MIPRPRTILLLGLVACAAPPNPPVSPAAAGDAPPDTDIFLAPLVEQGGRLRLGEPVNLTRRPGYDNQPHFTPDRRALLFSASDGGQTDIFRLDLAGGELRRLTRTPESEYSPTPLPDGGFSVVRVEADSAQRLWRFSDTGADPALVLPGVQPVGYHAWADRHTVALYVLGDPATLQLADTRTGRTETLARGIGRSLQRIPGRNAVSFVERVSDAESWISEVDVATGSIRRLVRAPGGGDFHAWTPDGTLLMSEDSRILLWDPARGGEWREIADLAPLRVSRLTVSPDGSRLALVAERAPE